jgi:hypothetical protein
MFNTKESEKIKYTNIFKSFDNGFHLYDETVTTTLEKPETGLLVRLRQEVYATNVGLVYRHIEESDALNGPKNGFEVKLRLK